MFRQDLWASVLAARSENLLRMSPDMNLVPYEDNPTSISHSKDHKLGGKKKRMELSTPWPSLSSTPSDFYPAYCGLLSWFIPCLSLPPLYAGSV